MASSSSTKFVNEKNVEKGSLVPVTGSNTIEPEVPVNDVLRIAANRSSPVKLYGLLPLVLTRAQDASPIETTASYKNGNIISRAGFL